MTGSPPATATCANRSPASAYGTPDGWIVELQHSNLSVDEIGEREQFYGPKMIWLWDCRNARAEGRLDIR